MVDAGSSLAFLLLGSSEPVFSTGMGVETDREEERLYVFSELVSEGWGRLPLFFCMKKRWGLGSKWYRLGDWHTNLFSKLRFLINGVV